MTTLAGHTLFPHRANWTQDPDWQRAWDTEVSQGLTGVESRSGHRSEPRRTLSYLVTALSLAENSALDDRIRAAKKSGKACAPFWGLASVLAAPFTAVDVLIQDTAWDWQAGDYIFVMDAAGNWETIDITSVSDDGLQLTTSAPLENVYPTGRQVWPLLFGKFTCSDNSAQTSQRGEIQLTISEQRSPMSTQLGALVASSGTGIGVFIIGTTFLIA